MGGLLPAEMLLMEGATLGFDVGDVVIMACATTGDNVGAPSSAATEDAVGSMGAKVRPDGDTDGDTVAVGVVEGEPL